MSSRKASEPSLAPEAPPIIGDIQEAGLKCDVSKWKVGKFDASRLSKAQYINTLTSLLTRALSNSESQLVLADAEVSSRIPEDGPSKFVDRPMPFDSTFAQGAFEVADRVGNSLRTRGYLEKVVRAYATLDQANCQGALLSNLSVNCRQAFVRGWTLRAFRRPLDPAVEMSASFQAAMGSGGDVPTVLESLIVSTLLQPQFLMHLQLDQAATSSPALARLSSYGVISRASYLLWRDMPDEKLLSLAARNPFSKSDLAEAVQHLLTARPDKIQATLDLFVRGWLDLNTLPPLPSPSAKLSYLTPGIQVNQALLQEMSQEVSDLFQYVALQNKGHSELLTSNISFARSPSLMKIYGQETPAPTVVTDLNAVRFPDGERVGLLTRAALLFSGTTIDKPAHRSVTIRKKFFCQPMPPPPPEAMAAAGVIEQNETLTTRRAVENLTQVGSCAGCHSLINPVGFAFGHYGPFGQTRDVEPIFSNNQKVADLPIDSQAVVLGLFRDGVPRPVKDGVELSAAAARSPDFQRCLSEYIHWFGSAQANQPDQSESCQVAEVYQAGSNGKLLDMLTAPILGYDFGFRSFEK